MGTCADEVNDVRPTRHIWGGLIRAGVDDPRGKGTGDPRGKGTADPHGKGTGGPDPRGKGTARADPRGIGTVGPDRQGMGTGARFAREGTFGPGVSLVT